MIRTRVLTLAFAGAVSAMTTAQAGAQSPNPASIAPGSSGPGLAPPTSPAPSSSPRTSAPDPAPGGNTVQAPTGTVTPQGSGLAAQSHSKK
jgi:hypothetical protein